MAMGCGFAALPVVFALFSAFALGLAGTIVWPCELGGLVFCVDAGAGVLEEFVDGAATPTGALRRGAGIGYGFSASAVSASAVAQTGVCALVRE